jgi:hypothetical protein
MSAIQPLLKPNQLEGKTTLTPKQRAEKRKELFKKQRGICACGCGQQMSDDHGYFSSATLEHVIPEPMGCKKNDNDSNLAAFRWDCNVNKGSRRT